jgi:hypothetical protein
MKKATSSPKKGACCFLCLDLPEPAVGIGVRVKVRVGIGIPRKEDGEEEVDMAPSAAEHDGMRLIFRQGLKLLVPLVIAIPLLVRRKFGLIRLHFALCTPLMSDVQ